MCGIFGYYRLKAGSHVHPSFKKLAFEHLKHRGPDAHSFKEYDNIAGIGHLRLSIIDTSTNANQPMESHLSSISFNGEIYNYKEIKQELLSHAIFKTTSDTEVLQAGIEKKGLTFLNRCNGMFAFAQYFKQKRNLLLVRDRFGVKPLYYCIENNILYFASEMRPLFLIKRKITRNKTYYDSFFVDTATDYDQSTFIEDIFQLKSGHALLCSNKGWEIKRWYRNSDFSFNNNIFKNKEETISFTEELLTDAIKIRLRADVPLCITLSGGLDSTLIYTLIKEKLKRDIQPFTFIQPDSPHSEENSVKSLVQKYNDDYIPIQLPSYKDFKTLKLALKHLTFPSWSVSILPYWHTYKLIAQNGYKVIIEGHGSDEQLGGYPYMIKAAYQECLLSGKYANAYRLHILLQKMSGNGSKSTGPALFKSIASDLIFLTKMRQKASFQAVLDQAFNYKIIPIVLRIFDRMSMAHSLESRSPFIDYRLVEYFRQMPHHYKVNSIGPKAILREILKRHNQEVLYRDLIKKGFGFDEKHFYQNPDNQNRMKDVLISYTDQPYEKQRLQALEYLRVQDFSNQNINAIWKVFALSITDKGLFN